MDLNPLKVLTTLAGLANGPDVATAAADAVTGNKTDSSVSGGVYVKIVLVVLGLLLIAAGIFGYDKTRAVIVKGSEAAAAV